MANLTSLLYPISAAVTNSVVNWSNFSQTTTSALTSKILSYSGSSLYIANIDGISFAPYDQYLQAWKGIPGSSALVWTQLIKSNENFNFEFSKGLNCSPVNIVNSTSPLAYVAGNNDLFATTRYLSG